MSCTNCFNGCTDTISDQCIKYTGIDIPSLGIHTGDSLSSIEQSLTTYLISTLNGTGIKIDLSTITICSLVNQYLPSCGDITIVDISKALIQSACSLQTQITAIQSELAILNGDYTIGCLSEVTSSTDTHAIVQAVINKLCQLQLDVTALALDLTTNYVAAGTPLNNYIAAYLASIGTSTLVSSKMVPYSILPFWGDIVGKFDSTGAGLGDWARIFLCNGLNATPDLRGRIPVGITNMSRSDFPDQTRPNVFGNPDYSTTGIVAGDNQITLLSTQIPAHTHDATVVITDPGHTHTVDHSDDNTSQLPGNGFKSSQTAINGTNLIASSFTGLKGTGAGQNVFVTNSSVGNNAPHSNIQPVISVYYIIYIPL